MRGLKNGNGERPGLKNKKVAGFAKKISPLERDWKHIQDHRKNISSIRRDREGDGGKGSVAHPCFRLGAAALQLRKLKRQTHDTGAKAKARDF